MFLNTSSSKYTSPLEKKKLYDQHERLKRLYEPHRHHYSNNGETFDPWDSNYVNNLFGPSSQRKKTLHTIHQGLVSKSLLDISRAVNKDQLWEMSDQSPKTDELSQAQMYSSLALTLKYVNCLERFGPNSNLQGAAPYLTESKYLFGRFFNWFYHPKFGYNVYFLLKKSLTKPSLSLPEMRRRKEFFKATFLDYQQFYNLDYELNASVSFLTYGLAKTFFLEKHLSRTARLLIQVYNAPFWNTLNSKEKYVFLKKLVAISRQKGSYQLINSLFDIIKLKLVTVKDKQELHVLLKSGSAYETINLGVRSLSKSIYLDFGNSPAVGKLNPKELGLNVYVLLVY